MKGDRIWAALLVVSLLAVLLALRPPPAPSPGAPALRPLFGPEERVDDWLAIELDDGTAVTRLERGVAWKPAQRDALRLFRNARLERRMDKAAGRLRYGLAPPNFAIRVLREGKSPAQRVLEVGDLAPDAMSVYVAAPDAPQGLDAAMDTAISKLPTYQIENLEALLRP